MTDILQITRVSFVGGSIASDLFGIDVVVLYSTHLVVTGLAESWALSHLSLLLPEGLVLCPLFTC